MEIDDIWVSNKGAAAADSAGAFGERPAVHAAADGREDGPGAGLPCYGEEDGFAAHRVVGPFWSRAGCEGGAPPVVRGVLEEVGVADCLEERGCVLV